MPFRFSSLYDSLSRRMINTKPSKEKSNKSVNLGSGEIPVRVDHVELECRKSNPNDRMFVADAEQDDEDFFENNRRWSVNVQPLLMGLYMVLIVAVVLGTLIPNVITLNITTETLTQAVNTQNVESDQLVATIITNLTDSDLKVTLQTLAYPVWQHFVAMRQGALHVCERVITDYYMGLAIVLEGPNGTYPDNATTSFFISAMQDQNNWLGTSADRGPTALEKIGLEVIWNNNAAIVIDTYCFAGKCDKNVSSALAQGEFARATWAATPIREGVLLDLLFNETMVVEPIKPGNWDTKGNFGPDYQITKTRRFLSQSNNKATAVVEGKWTDVWGRHLPGNKTELSISYTVPLAACGTYNCSTGVIVLGVQSRELSRVFKTMLDQQFSAYLPANPPTDAIGTFVLVWTIDYKGLLFAGASGGSDITEIDPFVPMGNRTGSIGAAIRLLESTAYPLDNEQEWFKFARSSPRETIQMYFSLQNGTAMAVDRETCIKSRRQACQTVVVQGFSLPTPIESLYVQANETNAPFFVLGLVGMYDVLSVNALQEVAKYNNFISTNNQHIDNTVNASKRQALIVATLLGVGLILVGAMVAWCIIRSMLAPLLVLGKAMNDLERFKLLSVGKPSRINEISSMQKAFLRMRASMFTFSKFVPETVVRNIIRSKEARGIYTRPENVTILFSDIKGFTSISEALDCNELLVFMTDYLSEMTDIVESTGGVVGEVLGDGILAFWNTPDDVVEHPTNAVLSAIRQHQALPMLNERFKDLFALRKVDPVSVRIGLNTGQVITGNIGSHRKMKFGCIGDEMNVAARLEGLCKIYAVGILISGETERRLSPIIKTRLVDVVTVKGKTLPTKIYQVLEGTEALTEEEFGVYDAALRNYQAGEFLSCQQLLASLGDTSDGPANYLMARVRKAIKEFGPVYKDDAWTGVNHLDIK
mmetsp:Transcript_38168/g.61940  ORF Transcript_38168/g.61940 Transcript_38168/m.61940 type:complete len:933 (-) Transcript_38168:36-2834(-)